MLLGMRDISGPGTEPMSHALVGKFLTTRPPPSLKKTTLKKYKYIEELYQHGHSTFVSILPVWALSKPNPPQAPEFQHKGVPDIQTSLLSSVSKSFSLTVFPTVGSEGQSQSHEMLFNKMFQ